jgi:hypothetical protein
MIAVRVVCVWMVFDMRECMFRENLTGGMRISVFGIATSSFAILYSMTRRASDLRSARLRQFRCPVMLPTLKVLVVSNIPCSPTLYQF